MEIPELELPPTSPLAASITAEWGLIPLRVTTGWTTQINSFSARRLASGLVEVNDSEDLLWMERLRPSWVEEDEGRPWKSVGLDVGWYRDHFRVVVLDPGWDNLGGDHRTKDLDDLVGTIERWLEDPPVREWR